MKYLHWLFFSLFFACILAYAFQQYKIYSHTGHGMAIFDLETQSADQIPVLFDSWKSRPIHHHTVFDEARLNTRVDFIFIIGYVGVCVIISYSLLQRQKNAMLNNVLRLCILLALLAGVLDVIENIILLADFTRFANGEGPMHSAAIVAIPKWILVIIIVLCWVIAAIVSTIKKQSSPYAS